MVTVLASPQISQAANRYVSTTGTDAGLCATETAPCRSFAFAYQSATAGDTVLVAGGTYGAQTIPRVTGRTGAPVEFRPATSAKVTIGDLSIRGDYVTIRDIDADFLNVDAGNQGATQVTGASVHNMTARGMWIWAARDLLVRGGSFGPLTNMPVAQIAANPPSYNVTMDGVDFHDALATNATVHTECLWAGGVQGLTVRNSLFRNCTYFDIFITKYLGPDPRDILLENNVFEATKSWDGTPQPYAINVANHVTNATNYTFRNNTIATDVVVQSTQISNFAIRGNTGNVVSCKSGVTYTSNVWASKKCGTTDKQDAGVSNQYVDPAAHDWRLKAGAPAIDSADQTSFPAVDRAGTTRSQPADAGAYEYGTSGPVATPTPTPTPSVTPAPTVTPTPTAAPDTQAPSVPQGMAFSGTTENSISLRWNATTDNVGVAGYRLYRNGVAVGTTTGTTYSVTGLTCNTSYEIGLTAFDAAGNESNRAYASGTTTTAACPPPTPSPTPTATPSPTPSPTPTATPSPTPSPTPTATPSPTPTPAPPAAPTTSGLVGAWSFDEASGSTVQDSSGAGNAGVISGALRETGRYGKALTFDGGNDVVTVPDSNSLDLTSALTIEAWVKPAANGKLWRTVALKEQTGHLAYALYSNNGAEQLTGNVFSGRDDSQVSSTPAPAVGKWTHIATTWDGSVQRVFMDGKEVAKVALSGQMPSSTKPLRFGGNAIWAEWFKGQLDEIRIYSRALSASEIAKDRETPIINTSARIASVRSRAAVATVKPKLSKAAARVKPSKTRTHARTAKRR